MGISIGDAARLTGVQASAIRYYEKAGLIRVPGRKSGRRVYDIDALDEIGFVTRARAAGLGIAEIARLRQLSRDNPECEEARDFARTKIDELDRQIAAATRLRTDLKQLAGRECSSEDNCAVLSGPGLLASTRDGG